MYMSYKLYVHITPENKLYIGVTQQRSCAVRWNCGRNYTTGKFKLAVERFGWSNIQHIVLFDNLSKEMAYECEKYLIHKYHTTDDRYGYNTSEGGDRLGAPLTEIHKQKISDSEKGKKLSEETKQKIREAMLKNPNRGMLGKHMSEEAKQKISKANTGHTVSDEARKKMSLAKKGKPSHRKGQKMSEEACRKMSEAHKGKEPWNKGKKLTEEHRRKLSESHKKKGV